MRFASSLSLLSLALAFSRTHASPTALGQLKPRQVHPDAEIEDYLTDVTKWCGLNENTDLEKAKTALRVSTLGASIDTFLTSDTSVPPTQWVREIRKFILHKWKPGESESLRVANCARTGAECEPGIVDMECYDYFNMGNPTGGKDMRYDWSKIGYWIFTAIKGVHSKMTEFEKFFSEEIIAQTLEIDGLAESIREGIDNSKVNLSGFINGLSIGLGVGSTVAGTMPGIGGAVSAGLSLAGTLVDNVELEGDNDVKISNAKSELGKRFRRTTTLIGDVLAAAMGEPHQEDHYRLLDQFAVVDFSAHRVTNFLDNPFWLIDTNSDAFREVLDRMRVMMRQQLFKSLLVASNVRIVGRKEGLGEAKNLDQCEGRNAGRRWLEVNGESYCFGLSHHDGNGLIEMDWDSNVYGLMHGYNINIFSQFYWNAIECALSGGVGDDGKPSQMEMVDKYPRCFFNIPVQVSYLENDSDPNVGPHIAFRDVK